MIDIGAEAIDRASSFGPGYQFISLDNPANEAGKIVTVEIWAFEDMVDCKIGTFYNSNGAGWYACRDFEVIGAVTAGSKVTKTGLSIDCEVGDLIGWFCPVTGRIEKDSAGFLGLLYKQNDQSETGSQLYATYAGDAMSVKALGSEAAQGPKMFMIG